jgi:pimeloyl-ACP methyl ester carboxylesterase
MVILGGPARASDPLTIAAQGSVGGRDVASDTLSTLPAYAPSGTISVDQIYVRYQEPVSPARPPLVLIHGCCLTGKTWETTPDGRMGWDEFFVRRGFPTYVIDQAWRGRSAASPAQINAVKTGQADPNTLPNTRRCSRACSSPWRRRASSGNRWSPTGRRR